MKKFILTESQYRILLKEMSDDISMPDMYKNVLSNPSPKRGTTISPEKDLGAFDGWKRVRRSGINKMNLKNVETGEYISPTWYDFVGSMINGIAIVIDNSKGVNAIDANGELLFRSWHEDINEKKDGEEYIIKDGPRVVVRTREEILNNRSLNESAMQEIDDTSKKVDWKVYVNGKLDKTFTKWAKKWKKKPKVGHGWYTGGAVFDIKKINGNKVYTEEKK